MVSNGRTARAAWGCGGRGGAARAWLVLQEAVTGRMALTEPLW